ncbi:MAG: DnaJ domain-containing protein [Sphaerochaetaceae bacterium]|nr:DnaJ domain-containing protein [Sphaerochaetaceae bacterium]
MFFYFPFGGGGGFGGFLVFLIVFLLLRRVFKSLYNSSQGNSSFNPFFRSSAYVPSNEAFFNGVFSMLAKFASADGNISEAAKARINQFMVYDLKLDNQSYQYARHVFNSALSSPETFETVAQRFYSAFAGNPGILSVVLEMLFSVGMTDGKLSDREQRMIDYVVRLFRISAESVEALKRRYGVSSGSSSRAYEILGLQKTATEAEIKKAYRKLILEFHPDTVANKEGAGEEFRAYAAKRFQEVQNAYEQICKERGIK